MNGMFFDGLYWEFLNGGAPVTDPAKIPGDWHEIKAWAEDLLAVKETAE